MTDAGDWLYWVDLINEALDVDAWHDVLVRLSPEGNDDDG